MNITKCSLRSPKRARVLVETLEERSLMSYGVAGSPPPPLPLSGAAPFRMGAFIEKVGPGFVSKTPDFYAHYTGPRFPYLDPTGLRAIVINQGQSLFLQGNLAGPIIPSINQGGVLPTYVFGINRGGATYPGPFPGKGNVKFDAVVIIAATPNGFVGGVTDITNGMKTTLTPGSFQIRGNSVSAIVPLTSLPSTGVAPVNYQVNFWTRSAPPSAGADAIGGFAPENSNAPVGAIFGGPPVTPIGRIMNYQPPFLTANIGPGFAQKSPRFYPLYMGPQTPDLNAVGVSATITTFGQVLMLKGTMQGAIPTHPMNASQSAFYVFGINRGSATYPGPFPDRGNILFDSVVFVSDQPSGLTANVVNLTTGAETALPGQYASIRGNTVQVLVPTSLLPSTGALLSQYTVNLWPRNVLNLHSNNVISSFVPEYGDVTVATRYFRF